MRLCALNDNISHTFCSKYTDTCMTILNMHLINTYFSKRIYMYMHKQKFLFLYIFKKYM